MRILDIVLSFLRTAMSKMWIAILFGVLSIAAQNMAGPSLTQYGGFFPQAVACIASGLVYLAWAIFKNHESFRGRGREFWLGSVLGMSVSNAVVTVCYVASVAAGLPVGVLTAVMGGGMIAAIVIKGWGETSGRLRTLMVASAAVTSLGIGIFPLTSGGAVHAMGLFFAGLAAAALCIYLVGFQKASKTTGELHIATGITVAGLLLAPASAVESVLAGHLKGGEWLHSPSATIMMIALGLAWMGAVNFLNRRAANRLSGTGFSAIQPLASPIALFTQVVIMHNAATMGTYIADAFIVAGGLLAFCVELQIQRKPKAEAESPRPTIEWQVPANADTDILEAVQRKSDHAVELAHAELINNDELLARIIDEIFDEPAVKARIRTRALNSVAAEVRQALDAIMEPSG